MAAAALLLLGLSTYSSLTGKRHKDMESTPPKRINPVVALQLLSCLGSPRFTEVSSFSVSQDDLDELKGMVKK